MKRKPFQIVRINIPVPIGSQKQLIEILAKEKDSTVRTKMLQDALYPNRLKRVDEDKK